jgi:hypothetical protein
MYNEASSICQVRRLLQVFNNDFFYAKSAGKVHLQKQKMPNNPKMQLRQSATPLVVNELKNLCF